jgi:hypothetical protein
MVQLLAGHQRAARRGKVCSAPQVGSGGYSYWQMILIETAHPAYPE